MSGIVGNLPNILQNGTTGDATQVMADLNFIVRELEMKARELGYEVPA